MEAHNIFFGYWLSDSSDGDDNNTQGKFPDLMWPLLYFPLTDHMIKLIKDKLLCGIITIAKNSLHQSSNRQPLH